jgi:hypothetical protein
MKFEQTPQTFPKHIRMDTIEGGNTMLDIKPKITSYDVGPRATVTVHVKGPKVDLILENVKYLEIFE